MLTDSSQPKKVAIVGGGVGGMTSALELSHPKHKGQYDITVYQMGWRLGGKGASGRGVHDRIEEHGLHLWLGFYENAFRTLRECYVELDRDPNICPISTFEDAFSPEPWVSVADKNLDGSWQVWTSKFPTSPGLPGDPLDKAGDPNSIPHYMGRAFRLMLTLLESVSDAKPRTEGEREPEQVTEQLDTILKYGQLITVTSLVEAVSIGLDLIHWGIPGRAGSLEALLERIQASGQMHLATLARGDDQLRRMWIVIDLILTCLRGIYRFKLHAHPLGFDAINDYDFREWLELNGADKQTTESAFVRGSCYDLTFAYRDGDVTQPAFAAGVASL